MIAKRSQKGKNSAIIWKQHFCDRFRSLAIVCDPVTAIDRQTNWQTSINCEHREIIWNHCAIETHPIIVHIRPISLSKNNTGRTDDFLLRAFAILSNLKHNLRSNEWTISAIKRKPRFMGFTQLGMKGTDISIVNSTASSGHKHKPLLEENSFNLATEMSPLIAIEDFFEFQVRH